MATRRFSRLKARLSARRNEEVAMGSEADFAISAAEVNERFPFLGIGVDDFADEDRVVSALERLRHLARQPRDRAADQRHAELAADDLRAGEFVLLARGETARNLRLLAAEDADRDRPRARDPMAC